MNTSRTSAIILRRINYAEADRILTLLTKDFGKLSVLAKGVRREKSKLAGGIELFSESDISFIKGRGEVSTLVSSQLLRHFGNIHTELERMQIASEFLKRLDTVTEQEAGGDFYDLCVAVFIALNTKEIPAIVTKAWGTMRLMLLLGESINVEKDAHGSVFDADQSYRFSYEEGMFYPSDQGSSANVVKLLRMLGHDTPSAIVRVVGYADLIEETTRILELAYTYHRPQTR